MIALINEELRETGIFIISAQKVMKLQDLTSLKGKKLTDWNQVVRYCLQQLRMNKWVWITDCKTFETTLLKPDSIDDYTQSGGILNTAKDEA